MRSTLSSLFVACLAVCAAACSSGPIAGTSQVAHDVGSIVIEALPPGFHSIGEIAVNALIGLAEHEGWTKEQFVAAAQAVDLNVGAASNAPVIRSLASDPAAAKLAESYIAKLTAAGR
jgi:hypothetical protein